jgi:hypothetical protein
MFLTEMLLVLYFLRPWSAFNRYLQYQRSAAITLTSAIFLQVVCLCLLWAIRFVVIVTHAVEKPSGVVTKPFDFYALAKDSKPAILRMISGVAIRCANFCTLNIHKVHHLRSHDRHWFVFLLRRIFTIVIALALLAFSYTNLVLEPVEETATTPLKMYTAFSAFSKDIVDANWSIIAVSKIPILKICLSRTVKTCHRQFARNDTFGDTSKLQEAINVTARLDSENGKSLASH